MSKDPDLDLATAPTAPLTPSDGHRALQRLVGAWHGTTRTWLDPSAPPDEGQTDARVEAILGGRFVRLEYRGTVIGKSHAGEMLIGHDGTENRFTSAWVDSFHMATGIMLSRGEPRDDGAISVLGSYEAGGETWGWKTILRRVDDDNLSIDSFNVMPDGTEHRAVESRLTARG
jgi:hypothetical protein